VIDVDWVCQLVGVDFSLPGERELGNFPKKEGIGERHAEAGKASPTRALKAAIRVVQSRAYGTDLGLGFSVTPQFLYAPEGR